MTKIGNLKKLFNKHKIDGYLIPKMMSFSMNMFQKKKII